MNITEIRNRTHVGQKKATENFGKSKVRSYLDHEIMVNADAGNNSLELNYYGVKYNVYGSAYTGPSIDDAINYYRSQGYDARTTFHYAPNGRCNTCLMISW